VDFKGLTTNVYAPCNHSVQHKLFARKVNGDSYCSICREFAELTDTINIMQCLKSSFVEPSDRSDQSGATTGCERDEILLQFILIIWKTKGKQGERMHPCGLR
jgi:hypothetical protein